MERERQRRPAPVPQSDRPATCLQRAALPGASPCEVANPRLVRQRQSLASLFGPAVLQPYRRVDPEGFQVQRQAGPGARQPFTLASDQITPQDRPEGLAGRNMGYAMQTPAHPPILLSDDGTLAVDALDGEPREFYAATDVLAASNAALRAAGSPVVLQDGGNRIQPHGGAALQMVVPTLEGEAPPDAGSFVALAHTICRDVAKQIIGGAITHARLAPERPGGAPVHARIDTTGSQAVGGVHELAGELLEPRIGVRKARKVLKAGVSEAVRSPPLTGREYGLAQAGPGLPQRAEELGLNRAARADVGEAYLTQTVAAASGTQDDYTSGQKQTRGFIWGYHFGAVVAQSGDGADRVTMENYNRDSDIKAGRAALLQDLQVRYQERLQGVALEGDERHRIGRILVELQGQGDRSVEAALAAYGAMYKERLSRTGAMWYFRLVGSRQGQSFHEQQADSGYFANPMTLVVANLSMPSRHVLFAVGSAALDPEQDQVLQDFARVVHDRIRRGAKLPKLLVQGCSSGPPERSAVARERATVVIERLVALGLPARKLARRVQDAGTWGSPKNSRRVSLDFVG